MRITNRWAARLAHRGEGGFSTGGAVMGLAATATLGGMLLMSGGEQVAAAEKTACDYEKTIVLTAIESDRLLDDDLEYATPAGSDGLDEIRTEGLLLTKSTYWVYEGIDATKHIVLTPQRPDVGCA